MPSYHVNTQPSDPNPLAGAVDRTATTRDEAVPATVTEPTPGAFAFAANNDGAPQTGTSSIGIVDGAGPNGTPWVLRYVYGETCVVEYFADEESAASRGRFFDLAARRGLNPISVAAVEQAAAAKGQDPDVLVRQGLSIWQKSGGTMLDPATTVGDALDARLAIARADPDLRPSSLCNLVCKVKVLKAALGSCRASALQGLTVRTFLDALPDRQGRKGGAAQSTKHEYAKVLASALEVVGARYPLTEDPEYAVPAIEFLTIEQVIAVLAATPTHARGAMVLALFAFLRPELVGKLRPSDIDYTKRTITIPARFSKDKRKHILKTEIHLPNGHTDPGLLEIVWVWLKVYPFKPIKWTTLRAYLKQKLGWWSHDIIRHTGATYYNTLYGRVETAKMLTHSGLRTSVCHYLGSATRQNGLRFIALTPDMIPFRREPRRVYDIPAAELQRIIWLKPRWALAADLGCSRYAFYSLVRRHNIKAPHIGYWRWRTFSKEKVVIGYP